MTLTVERAELLAKYLTDNTDRAKAMLELTPEAAAEKINADGFDFTVEEIVEFGAQVRAAASQEGELGEDSLDEVAGGVGPLAILGVAFAVKVAYDVGRVVGKNAPW